jgi:hypothetical protein
LSEYTAHVQVPDAAIGAVLHEVLLGHDAVTCATLRSGSGTWLSFGFNADSDDAATMMSSTIRYRSSRVTDIVPPAGYEKESLLSFESAPMIITQGRVVIYSEGI